ncbi:hypothetical protein O181_078284 [Austropuccinia psidii MF-1]|uniref:Reverse transcriptase Ty1/copia-type domain-containing protein n=1 Tax=Austropuccinia psidii MF-1 TaxID=1389203 RepID=A0A9Q3IH57_9BASI|nr:hypothetical protein [Austropuccinia psidii MF-1]
MIQRKDLTAKARRMIHLGVAQDSQGWVFWDPKLQQLCRSASVIFYENEFLTSQAGSTAINQITAKSIFDDSIVREIDAQDSFYELFQVSSSFCTGTPSTYFDALNSKEGGAWKEACEEELRNLNEMGVWHEIARPSDVQVLGTRWVFATKLNQHGDIVRYKARLVVQGHRQIKGVNFEETFAPTPTFTTLRAIFAIASAYKWRVTTFDVTTAYLHSKLEEDIYVRAPPGVAAGRDMVFKLNKALYGLKQAGGCWWLHLRTILQRIGFRANEEDQSTYVYHQDGDTAILWIHVDDGVMATSNDILWTKLKEELTKHLKLKWDEELSSIVGIEVMRKEDTFVLKQTSLINKLLSTCNNNFTAHEPLPKDNLISNRANQMDKQYLSKIGMILYLAQATRPDIMYAVNYLARFAMNTDESHWKALNHLINYIRTTKEQELIINSKGKTKDMKVYVDANWGGEGWRSQHGYCGFLMGSLVMWNLKRQSCIAASTCQAEYMVLSFGAKEALWLLRNVEGVTGHIRPTILSDNQSAVKIAENAGSRKNSRHIAREFHIINELVVNKKVNLEWVKTRHQLADIFTKSLGRVKIQSFIEAMGGLWGGVLKNNSNQ